MNSGYLFLPDKLEPLLSSLSRDRSCICDGRESGVGEADRSGQRTGSGSDRRQWPGKEGVCERGLCWFSSHTHYALCSSSLRLIFTHSSSCQASVARILNRNVKAGENSLEKQSLKRAGVEIMSDRKWWITGVCCWQKRLSSLHRVGNVISYRFQIPRSRTHPVELNEKRQIPKYKLDPSQLPTRRFASAFPRKADVWEIIPARNTGWMLLCCD